MPTITKEHVESKVDEILSKPYILTLWNDEINSFDHVIECLMKICFHTFEQANQSSLIVHHNGKCDVKYGSMEELNIMREKLQNESLTVTIEPNF